MQDKHDPNDLAESADDLALSGSEAHLTEDEARLLDELGLFGAARRRFLGQTSAAVVGTFAFQLLAQEEALAQLTPAPDAVVAPTAKLENAVRVMMKINGAPQRMEVDSRAALLDTLRERLALTGTKKGCDQGQCGACTVIVNGRRVLSCLTLAATCDGKEITTIEGLAKGDQLHPMQAAFIKHDGFQCGYCTSGQICSAVALLKEAQNGEASHVTDNVRERPRNLQLSEDEIKERMSGNICRCGAYPGIVAAIKEVQSGTPTRLTWEFASEQQITLAMNGEGRTDEVV